MKALVISGFGPDEERGPAALAALESSLAARGLDVEVVDAAAADVRPCVGCGSCGLKTPGRCVVSDEMQAIYPRLVACDVMVLAGPVSFGAHCSPIKRIVDRLQPLMAPLYTTRNGELKFRPRYPRRAAWVGVGMVAAGDPMRDAQAAAYRLLLERHAVNVAAPSSGAAVITGESPDADRVELEAALDAGLGPAPARAAHPAPVTHGDAAVGPSERAGGDTGDGGPVRSVLVIQGSRRKRANTRAIVAHLRVELEKLGVTTCVFHVPVKGVAADDLDEVRRQLRAHEAVVLAAPLYFDGLPPATQSLLERLAERRDALGGLAPRLYALAHSGFPEPIQRETELRSMALFAAAMGWRWRGGVGFGGTSPIDGRPLDEAGMFAKQLRAALPGVAADIAAGGRFSTGTVDQCDEPPFPIPAWLLVPLINTRTRKTARRDGVDLLGLPYATAEDRQAAGSAGTVAG